MTYFVFVIFLVGLSEHVFRVQAMQGFGPRGADLLLRCTAAATELGLRRPELLKEKDAFRTKDETRKSLGWHDDLMISIWWFDDWWWQGSDQGNGRRSPMRKKTGRTKKIWKASKQKIKSEIWKGKSVSESNESKCVFCLNSFVLYSHFP